MSDQVTELSREELLQRYGKKASRASASTRRSPFKFLDSYDIGDADIFFGRDSEIDELRQHFQSYGHVLIYGESGSGKSSLVQCGLRSRIPEADALFIPLRVHTAGLPTVGLQVCTHAFHALDEFVEVPDDAGLVETLRAVREAASRPLVLFFDQFEELFIFHDAKTRRRFAEELATIPQAKLNVKIIIGVRQDYLGHLSELEDTVEGLFDNRFWLRRMSRENAAQAVVKACGTCDVTIDNDLAESILHRLDPGGQGVELPYLQVVMDRLYRQAVDANPAQPVISAADVEKLGDIANILGSFLVEEVAKLPSPDTGRQILKAFVTREATRRTLDRDAVAQESAGFGAAIAPDVLDTHLNQLVNVRTLREIADSGTYELRHDALAATVASWISEVEKELIEVRDNLVNRFKEYEARGQDKGALLDQGFLDYLSVYKERLRPLVSKPLRQYMEDSQRHVGQTIRFRGRARRLVAVVVVGSIILAVFALVMYSLRTEAVAQRDLAVAAEFIAKQQRAEAQQQKAEAERQRAEAERQGVEAVRQQRLALVAEQDALKQKENAEVEKEKANAAEQIALAEKEKAEAAEIQAKAARETAERKAEQLDDLVNQFEDSMKEYIKNLEMAAMSSQDRRRALGLLATILESSPSDPLVQLSKDKLDALNAVDELDDIKSVGSFTLLKLFAERKSKLEPQQLADVVHSIGELGMNTNRAKRSEIVEFLNSRTKKESNPDEVVVAAVRSLVELAPETRWPPVLQSHYDGSLKILRKQVQLTQDNKLVGVLAIRDPQTGRNIKSLDGFKIQLLQISKSLKEEVDPRPDGRFQFPKEKVEPGTYTVVVSNADSVLAVSIDVVPWDGPPAEPLPQEMASEVVIGGAPIPRRDLMSLKDLSFVTDLLTLDMSRPANSHRLIATRRKPVYRLTLAQPQPPPSPQPQPRRSRRSQVPALSQVFGYFIEYRPDGAQEYRPPPVPYLDFDAYIVKDGRELATGPIQQNGAFAIPFPAQSIQDYSFVVVGRDELWMFSVHVPPSSDRSREIGGP